MDKTPESEYNMKTTLLAAMITFAAVCATPAQGPLTPPGAPAPTMKTLDQVEPRTPISSLPFNILQPGSYYLTTNLTGVSGWAGILINASGVTIDLMGFELVGVPGSREGIHVPFDQKNIEIKNGTVRNWGRHGVNAWNADNSLLLNLRAYTNGWEAALQDGLSIGANSRVMDCVAENNQDDGINVGFGSTVSGCTARDNGSGGIFASAGSTVSGCTAYQNGSDGIFAGSGSTVSACTALENGGIGIFGGNGSTVSGCTAYQNGSDGIYASFGSAVSGCTARYNGGHGISVGNGSKVSGCTAYQNGGDGILIPGASLVVGCNAYSNGNGGDGAGIHVTSSDNRIEGNNCTQNDRGIDVDTSGNFIVRNTCSGNGTNYDIAGTQTIGPIITATGTITSTNPWANFSY
jgi:parallel beta-helix repeat protein